jgi:hypothetical protein
LYQNIYFKERNRKTEKWWEMLRFVNCFQGKYTVYLVVYNTRRGPGVA